jgi:hypothetical protein
LPPVRNLLDVDPRVLALATDNAANPYWDGSRPNDHTDDELDIPRAWRAKGYEPVAELISAWLGRNVGAGTVRGWWRLDLRRGRSQSMPPPDAIIKRKGGVLLPGWSDETMREWLSNKASDRPFKTDMINMGTYLEWDDAHDEVAPELLALIAGNKAERMVPTFALQRYDGVPAAYLSLGYEPAARAISEARGIPVSENTVCKAWRDDLLRVNDVGEPAPYSRSMPVPDALISRGARAELLPGWTRATIEAWLPTRPGSGNHTRGEERRGRGSQQWWAEREAAEVVTA